jgi:hypothetical protein
LRVQSSDEFCFSTELASSFEPDTPNLPRQNLPNQRFHNPNHYDLLLVRLYYYWANEQGIPEEACPLAPLTLTVIAANEQGAHISAAARDLRPDCSAAAARIR